MKKAHRCGEAGSPEGSMRLKTQRAQVFQTELQEGPSRTKPAELVLVFFTSPVKIVFFRMFTDHSSVLAAEAKFLLVVRRSSVLEEKPPHLSSSFPSEQRRSSLRLKYTSLPWNNTSLFTCLWFQALTALTGSAEAPVLLLIFSDGFI